MNKPTAILLGIIAAAILAPLAEAKENDRFARVILVIPTAAEPPKNHDRRLASLALRAEGFFAKWMKHWHYPIERTEIFAREKDDSIAVTLVKADITNANGRDALPELRQKAIRGASIQLGLKPDSKTVWWIFYDYPGVKGFQGGARNFGGAAINAYPPGNDPIDPKADLASPENNKMAIKGTIHEFGHALGLPHIGPRPDVDLGNSLMGPINKSFWGRTGSKDTRVHLSQASAAALWKHPIFRKEATPSPPMPREVKVSELAIKEAHEGDKITVCGRLTASQPAHAAILLDSAAGHYGDYWERSYVGKIDKESGLFEIVITTPHDRGKLFLSFCFANGVSTSNGKLPFQRGSTIEVPYERKDGKRQFSTPSASN